MGSEKYSLMIETLKFLELCQLYLKNGKIDVKDYSSMTAVKLQFVSSFMKEEKVLLRENKKLRFLLNKIIVNHYILLIPSEKIVVTWA